MKLPFLCRAAGQNLTAVPLDAARYVVLDTELTSLDNRSSRLLSVGALAMDGGRIRLADQFYRLVNPGVDIPAPGVLIHGLRPHDVAHGDPACEVAGELTAFAANAVIVGHFVSIDLKALRKECPASLPNAAIDTAKIHAWMLRTGPLTEQSAHQMEQLDLESVARHYSLEYRDAHHALGDAYITAQLWQRMMPLLQKRKVMTLADVRRIGGMVS